MADGSPRGSGQGELKGMLDHCPGCGVEYDDHGHAHGGGEQVAGYAAKTKSGYFLDEVVSSFQKDIRRGKAYEAVFWARELVRSNYSNYAWRRLMVVASEDVALGDPDAVLLVRSLYDNWRDLINKKSPTVEEQDRMSLVLIHAVLAMVYANKNREAADANTVAEHRWRAGERLPIPEYAKDMHTAAGRAQGIRGRKGDVFFQMHSRRVSPEVEIDGNRFQKELYQLWQIDPVKGDLRTNNTAGAAKKFGVDEDLIGLGGTQAIEDSHKENDHGSSEDAPADPDF